MHARVALTRLDTKANMAVPPLRPDLVHRLRRELPALLGSAARAARIRIDYNGGVGTPEHVLSHALLDWTAATPAEVGDATERHRVATRLPLAHDPLPSVMVGRALRDSVLFAAVYDHLAHAIAFGPAWNARSSPVAPSHSSPASATVGASPLLSLVTADHGILRPEVSLRDVLRVFLSHAEQALLVPATHSATQSAAHSATQSVAAAVGAGGTEGYSTLPLRQWSDALLALFPTGSTHDKLGRALVVRARSTEPPPSWPRGPGARDLTAAAAELRGLSRRKRALFERYRRPAPAATPVDNAAPDSAADCATECATDSAAFSAADRAELAGIDARLEGVRQLQAEAMLEWLSALAEGRLPARVLAAHARGGGGGGGGSDGAGGDNQQWERQAEAWEEHLARPLLTPAIRKQVETTAQQWRTRLGVG